MNWGWYLCTYCSVRIFSHLLLHLEIAQGRQVDPQIVCVYGLENRLKDVVISREYCQGMLCLVGIVYYIIWYTRILNYNIT